jgi:hypothetical protein
MTDSALLPLIELESRPLPPELRGRVSWLRNLTMQRLEIARPIGKAGTGAARAALRLRGSKWRDAGCRASVPITIGSATASSTRG